MEEEEENKRDVIIVAVALSLWALIMVGGLGGIVLLNI